MKSFYVGQRISFDMLKVFGFKEVSKSKTTITFAFGEKTTKEIVVSRTKNRSPVILKMIGFDKIGYSRCF